MSDTPEIRDPATNSDPRLGLPSASKLERVAACPGSHLLEKTVKNVADEDEELTLAASGTRIHRARELSNTLDLSEEEFELYEAGLRCEAKQVEKWASLYGFKPDEIQPGPNELRLYLHNHSLEPCGSGQLDVHMTARGTYALICDWKSYYCSNLVGAVGNYQLRMQAVLLWLDQPNLTSIRVAFVKPMYEKEEPDYCDYTEIDLKYSYESIIQTLWWSTQPDAPRVPGPQCRYCRAKAHCPEALSYALLPSVIARMAAPDSVDIEEMVGKVAPEDLLKLWDMSTVVTKIIDAADARLKTFSKEELFRLGLELPEHGRARDTITKVRDAVKFLCETQGFSEDDLWAAMSLSKGKVSEIAQREKSLAKKWADRWVGETLKDYIIRTHDAPSLRRIKGL